MTIQELCAIIPVLFAIWLAFSAMLGIFINFFYYVCIKGDTTTETLERCIQVSMGIVGSILIILVGLNSIIK